MKNRLILSAFFISSSLVYAAPFVTTFVNTTEININLELHFSDKSMTSKGIAMKQSYQVVNFNDKILASLLCSSDDKDKNGNFYGQLDQKMVVLTDDVTYNIALQTVPAHTVAAGEGTQSFEMPDSQTIICTQVQPGQTTKSDTSKDTKDTKDTKKVTQAPAPIAAPSFIAVVPVTPAETSTPIITTPASTTVSTPAVVPGQIMTALASMSAPASATVTSTPTATPTP